MAAALDNLNPVVRERETLTRRKDEGVTQGLVGVSIADLASTAEDARDEREPIDAIEVFEHIRDIADPGKVAFRYQGFSPFPTARPVFPHPRNAARLTP